MITRGTLQAVLFVCALAVSAEAAAGTIYGFVQQSNQPVRQTSVVLNCGTEAATTVTDIRGNYSVRTVRTGRCNLVISGASASVVVYEEPTEYNFEILDGQLIRR